MDKCMSGITKSYEMTHIHINKRLRTPIYKQISKEVISNIELGYLKVGDQLPSINQLSIDYDLARDTVERAYKELKVKNVVKSHSGKGYYIVNGHPESRIRILVLFNKLSSYKKVIYNEITVALKGKADVDFIVYHCDLNLLYNILDSQDQVYNYYVIMPHFSSGYDKVLLNNLLKKIEPEKLIFLDHVIEGFEHVKGAVYQDFKMDIYNALSEGLNSLRKFQKLILVFPEKTSYPYPLEIVAGFNRFCGFNNIEPRIIDEVSTSTPVEMGNAYVVIEENDLANLVKISKNNGLCIPGDIGILSYNDTTLKEVLLDGISVITTDFKKMGQLTAQIIQNEKSGMIKNDFKLILRNSL